MSAAVLAQDCAETTAALPALLADPMVAELLELAESVPMRKRLRAAGGRVDVLFARLSDAETTELAEAVAAIRARHTGGRRG